MSLYKLLSTIGTIICAIGFGLLFVRDGSDLILYWGLGILAFGLGINTSAGITKIYNLKKSP